MSRWLPAGLIFGIAATLAWFLFFNPPRPVVVAVAPGAPVVAGMSAPEPRKVSARGPVAAPTESLPTTAAATNPPPPAGVQETTTVAGGALKPAGAPSPVTDPSGVAPETVMENLRGVFRNYAQQFGGNPVGTNPEITKALNGGNRRQVQYLNPEAGLRINAAGELVDPWGTPFFFHQLSGTEMEIHCAGPDTKMWTADDLVIK